MAIKKVQISYEEFDSMDECPKNIQELFKLACDASENAYAPYSEFKVGMAMELEDGSRYAASNQENKAYPSGLCAERTGLFYVNALKPKIAICDIVLVAVDKTGMIENPVYPCGACRQVMMESEERGGSSMQVWMVGSKKIHKVNSMKALLPLKFSFSH